MCTQPNPFEEFSIRFEAVAGNQCRTFEATLKILRNWKNLLCSTVSPKSLPVTLGICLSGNCKEGFDDRNITSVFSSLKTYGLSRMLDCLHMKVMS
jgi:hypothetical protein